MFWLACVATAQAPTLSDRVDALEAIVQKLESTVHEQRLTISSLQRALVSNTPSSTDAWPATAPRHRRQLSGTTTMLELKPDAAGSSATLEADGNGALSVTSPGGTSFAGDVSIGSTNSYGGGGYTSYLSRSTQPNGPQKASCEGTGADVKAWICCATECV